MSVGHRADSFPVAMCRHRAKANGGLALRQFRWLSAQDIPPEYDLRRCGWQKFAETPLFSGPAGNRFPALAPWPSAGVDGPVADARWRRSTVLLGVDSAADRARLLAMGFGEALPADVALGELAARVARVAELATMQPGHRDIGILRLDLMARDGLVHGRPLGLHPREFALLWRLAETPGTPLDKPRILAEVWRLTHVPETNTLAVHVARLRRKLEAEGLAGLVRTTPEGAYVLAMPEARSAIPLPAGEGMDRHVLAD